MYTLPTETNKDNEILNRAILYLLQLITRQDLRAIQAQVQSLRLRGIDLNTPYIGVRDGYRNITALCCAALHHLEGEVFGLEIPQLLIQNGADVNKGDADEFTPLHFACINREDRDLVEFLVEHGAKVWIRNADGNIPQDVIGRGGQHLSINLYLAEQTHNLRWQAYRWLLNGWNPPRQNPRRPSYYPIRRRDPPRYFYPGFNS